MRILFIISIFISSFGYSQTEAQAKIKWITVAQLDSIYTAQGSDSLDRKVFIDFYTDWCGWCKKMDAETFMADWVAKYMNGKYYAVKFNAEQEKPVKLGGKEYVFVPNGRRGYNTFASEILDGKLSYPSFALLENTLKPVQIIPGYQDAANFIRIVTYFGGNFHKKMPWELYNENWNTFYEVFAQ